MLPSFFCARSVLPVREHGKMGTCLRKAASAGIEPLASQPEPWPRSRQSWLQRRVRRLATFFNEPLSFRHRHDIPLNQRLLFEIPNP